MASLERIKNIYHVLFRFGGRHIRRTLATSNKSEAEAAKMQVELTLHRIRTGVLPPPPAEADVGLFVISGGKIERAILLPDPPPPMTLRILWESYHASFPAGAKDSLPTEKTHFGHFCRILGGDTALRAISTDDLQRYINTRSEEPGRRGKTVAPDTVEGEVETLTHVWDSFAVPRKIVPASFDDIGEV